MKKLIFLVALSATILCSGCGIERDRLLTQRTQANSGAIIAQAESAARQAESNASMINYKTLADAAKPDNTVLIVVLIGTFGMAGLVIYKLFEANKLQARTIYDALRLGQLPSQVLSDPQYRRIPAAVQFHAQRRGGVAEWDGNRWLIVDPTSNRILARERKQLTGTN